MGQTHISEPGSIFSEASTSKMTKLGGRCLPIWSFEITTDLEDH